MHIGKEYEQPSLQKNTGLNNIFILWFLNQLLERKLWSSTCKLENIQNMLLIPVLDLRDSKAPQLFLV